jgi:transcription initiation factor TFIID subunit 11
MQQWSNRRQSGSTGNSTAPPSRQGSVETDREGSVATTAAEEEEAEQNKQENNPDAEAEDDDDNKEDLIIDMDAHMQAQMEKAKEDMKILLENFSADQLQRYEGYRRSALNRTNVKRVNIKGYKQQERRG